jgi:hypothetical protein
VPAMSQEDVLTGTVAVGLVEGALRERLVVADCRYRRTTGLRHPKLQQPATQSGSPPAAVC